MSDRVVQLSGTDCRTKSNSGINVLFYMFVVEHSLHS